MKRLTVGMLALGLLGGVVAYGLAEAPDGPPGPPGANGRDAGERPAGDKVPVDRGPGERVPGERGQREFHVLPPGAKQALKLSTDQEQKIAELDKDVQEKLSKILTTEQLEQWKKAPPGPPPGRRGDRGGPPADGPRGRSARDDAGPGRGPDARRRPPADGPDGPGARENADRQPPRGRQGGLDRLFAELRLKDDQKDKVQEILKTHHEKMDQVMAEQRADLIKSMKSVLSSEQLEKLERALPEPGKAGPPPEGRDGPPRDRRAPPEE